MPSKSYPEFANWLENALASRRMSAAELGREIDRDPSLIGRWRRGKTPTLENLQLLADYFGVDRAKLEPLIGLRASTPASMQSHLTPAQQAEAEGHKAFFDRLIEEKIDPAFWKSYRDAAEALSEPFSRNATRPVSPDPTPLDDRHGRSANTSSRRRSNAGSPKKQHHAHEPVDELLTHVQQPAAQASQTLAVLRMKRGSLTMHARRVA